MVVSLYATFMWFLCHFCFLLKLNGLLCFITITYLNIAVKEGLFMILLMNVLSEADNQNMSRFDGPKFYRHLEQVNQ